MTPTNPPQYSISKILMDFRNTIQLERDKLYKTRNTDVTGVAQAQLKASEAINQLIYTQVLELIDSTNHDHTLFWADGRKILEDALKAKYIGGDSE